MSEKRDTYYATYAGWAEAFLIFAKYEPDSAFEVQAEHDEIYAGGQHYENYSEEDKARLEELHWIYNEELESYSHFT